MLSMIFGIVLILHGLVHLLYVGQSLKKFELTAGMVWPDRSWLFTKLLREENVLLLIAVCLAIAALGFISAGLGSLLRWNWWQPAVIGSAILSTLIFLLAWDGRFKALNDQGGIGVLIDLAVIILLKVVNWPA
jgi:hypothetical protein